MRVDELARRLECRCEGRCEAEISGIASLAAAGPADVSFITDSRRASEAPASRAGALIVSDDFPALTSAPGPALLRTPNPTLAMARAVALLRPAWRPAPGVDASARVHASAVLGRGCYVGPFAVIGENCVIGDAAVIHAHAVFYPNVVAGARLLAHAHVTVREGAVLGDDVTLQPGVVIGGDGFGFAADGQGHQVKIPQAGTVAIGNDVEIQANSCVDRASLEVTRIGNRVKVDNLTQIAHNCDIGDDALLCAQVGLAGSTRVGARAVLAGQVGVAGHCTVGEGTIITAQSGTHGDLAPGKMYSGSPAFEHGPWLRATAAFQRLADMQREIRYLRDQISRMQKQS
ncbi:MAG: UDP-3-O-(3-hydroxymyristoyl)glucosamine N-acyltransferase [Terriglobales bacterium]